MDAIQILIYIAVAIIYLVLKGVNKVTKSDSSGPTGEINGNPAIPEEQINQPPRKTGPLTFEDLLDEFGEVSRKAKKQLEAKRAGAKTSMQKAEGALDKDQRTLSQTNQPKRVKTMDKRQQTSRDKPSYESPFSYEQVPDQEYVPVYENKANQIDYEIPEKALYTGLDDQKKRFAAFDLPAAETSSVYTYFLKDPKSAKTAFILSEIFKRKYE